MRCQGNQSRVCQLVAVLLLSVGAQAFIRITGQQFTTEQCTPFVFTGYNTWQILENAAGRIGSKSDVTDQFDAAVTNDFSTVRIFAFGTASGFSLQTSPGQYNQQAWDALDYIISEAGDRGLRLILAIADNWDTDSNTDNKPFYVNSSPSAGGVQDAFYTDATASQNYQNHVKTLVNHVNSRTGTAYKNDPTIMSWNLINEPRCDKPNCSGLVQAWIEKQAAYVKSVDPNHLVTVGEDGFWDATACNSQANPGSWSGSTGQNFAMNHAASAIDYASIHLWPDNWERTDLDFARFWLLNHTAQATTLQKPLVIEEFGKEVNSSGSDLTEQTRLDFYKLVYFEAESSFQEGGPLQGLLFWRWNAVQNVDLGTSGVPGSSAQTVNTDSPTFQQVIMPFAQRTAATQNGTSRVSGCSTSGTVATASASGKPGPSTFAPPDISIVPGTCNAFSGYITGKIMTSTRATSAADCCAQCQGSSQCNSWNYCFCDAGCSAGSVTGGTCQLKTQSNNFYPRVDSTQSSGYIAGVTGVSNVTQQWQCQPSQPQCTLQNVDTCSAASLRASLQCPAGNCNATRTNVGGSVLTIDVNGDSPGHPVNTNQQCCDACRAKSGCNVWTFCPYLQGCDSGCANYVSTAKAGTSNPPFGQYSGCQGTAFPFGACTLKSQPGGLSNATVYASGFAQPWVSGGV